uniref:Retrotransposon Copia-like N-terminal domain-containing protein n=1 Tax=Nelumbo nucifera TaxID=4432 RepID=A0A822YJ05_NELNU|nr:TPA_asm: hypothetical protein HUJ06_009796 [Nelumbo nucifera]
MRNALCGKNKFGFVDGSIQKRRSTNEEQAWIKCNSMKDFHWDMFHESFSLKAIWDELAVYPIRDLAGERDRERVYRFLLGLSEVFNTVRFSILAMEPLPSVSKVYSLVSQEECHQNLVAHPTQNLDATMMHVAGQNLSSTSKNSRPQLCCDHCKRNDHTKDRCYELLGYPPNWEARGLSAPKQGNSG